MKEIKEGPEVEKLKRIITCSLCGRLWETYPTDLRHWFGEEHDEFHEFKCGGCGTTKGVKKWW